MSDSPASDCPPAQYEPRRGFRSALRIALVVTLVVAFYGLAVVYPPLRILGLIEPSLVGTTSILIMVLGPLAGRFLWEVAPGRLAQGLSAVSFTWLGVAFTVWPLVMLFDLANAFLDLPARVSGLSLAGLAVLLASVGIANALLPVIRSVRLDGKGRASGRIVQISDVHIGSRMPGFLNRIAPRVAAQAPDAVVITGDLIDFGGIEVDALQPLAELGAPTYFVIGNHERYVDCDAICDRLCQLGITVLRNETATQEPFHFLGIDDAENRRQVEKHLPSLAKRDDLYQVLLYHRPDGHDVAADAGMDLMLCGHTHGGQIIPFNLAVRRVFPQMLGQFTAAGCTLYVSAGTGTWGPVMRLGSRSEITVFEIGGEAA